MAVTVSYYAKAITWNSITWDTTSGGPLEVSHEHGGDNIEDRTGDNEYPPFNTIVNRALRVTVRIREVKQTLALNSKSSLVATLTIKPGGPTQTVTYAGMVLKDVRGAQGRATVGDTELVFVHESADAQAVPIS
jgi:hypothetical protein